jgi:hypothetical protein
MRHHHLQQPFTDPQTQMSRNLNLTRRSPNMLPEHAAPFAAAAALDNPSLGTQKIKLFSLHHRHNGPPVRRATKMALVACAATACSGTLI